MTAESAGESLCRRMTGLRPICDDLIRDLKALVRDRVEFAATRQFVTEGDRSPPIYIIESGWVFRTRTLPCGRRQIIDYSLAGDILCADSVLFGVSGFDLVARSTVKVLRVDAHNVADLWRRQPGFAAALAWTAAQEASIMAERIVSLGRRDSLEKLCFALCEMAHRLSAIGQMTGDTIETPINQEDFADILGISVIHVNRTFRRLSDERIADYNKNRIHLLDRKRLLDIAGFSADYLHIENG